MIRFYNRHRDSDYLYRINADHGTCADIVAFAPASILTKDIEEWFRDAEHGDRLELGHYSIYAIDLDLFNLTMP